MKQVKINKILVPELKGYYGSKGGNGVYQQIISLIPPHKILVIPFLGHCGIVRHIIPAGILIAVDASEIVINAWKKYLMRDLIYTYHDEGSHHYFIKNQNSLGSLPEIIYLFNDDALNFLPNVLPGIIHKYADAPAQVVIYQDPPYLKSSRKSQKDVYQYEMTKDQHVQLLSLNKKMLANILISTYDNALYRNELNSWNNHSFCATTRAGSSTETIYYNYNLDSGKLHDYRFLGNNFKDRERIRLKIDRWVSNLKKLDPRERMAIFKELEKSIL